MRFIETMELTDTDPKGYVGVPKVDKKTGKPLKKNGQEEDDEDEIPDEDMHKKPEEIPDNKIANKHEEITPMRTNPAYRQELLNLGIILPKDKAEATVVEDSPVRTALNIMRNSPNTIEEKKKEWNQTAGPIDKEKAKRDGAYGAGIAKAIIDDHKKTKEEAVQPKRRPIIW
jgi:hypothetical protein